MTSHEVADFVSTTDRRSELWLRHAVVVAARSLGIYSRGRDYSLAEARAIAAAVTKLFPPRA